MSNNENIMTTESATMANGGGGGGGDDDNNNNIIMTTATMAAGMTKTVSHPKAPQWRQKYRYIEYTTHFNTHYLTGKPIRGSHIWQ